MAGLFRGFDRPRRFVGKMLHGYPLQRSQDRTYPAGWSGRIYTWDIDKTYLATDIHSISALLAVPFEFAIDKRNIAGTPALLRALRRGVAVFGLTASNPLYFVSASPPELRRVLERKMLIDGVEYDGLTFKDHLQLILRGRFGTLREQIGYKLTALLLNRRELPWDAEETLFGDDSESDAVIYSLYADVVAGRLRGDPLVRTLLKQHVRREDADLIASLSQDMPSRELVTGLYINLEVHRDPRQFNAFGPRLIPCHDAFQAALRLAESGHIAHEGVLDVARSLVDTYRKRPPSLLRSAADMLARGAVRVDTVERLWPMLQGEGLAPEYFVVDPGLAARAPREPRPAEGAFFTPDALRAE